MSQTVERRPVTVQGAGNTTPNGLSPSSAFISTLTKVDAKPGEALIAAAWSFTNHGEAPLAVERIESSCGCLAGQTGSQIVEPGKSGRIEAVFQPGAYRGIIRKSIHVRFFDHPKPVELVMEAHIPSPVELSSNELSWTLGESMAAQTLEVNSGTGAPFAITELLGISPQLFEIEKETLTKGTRYRLKITPVGQPTPSTHILQVRTDSPDPRDQVLAVFLQVKPADAHPARPPTQTAAAP